MAGIYSSRALEQASRRDINFMYLLGRAPAPDHSTLARFRSERPPDYGRLVLSLVRYLAEVGELSLCNAFIDGTKFEASANRHMRKTLNLDLGILQ